MDLIEPRRLSRRRTDMPSGIETLVFLMFLGVCKKLNCMDYTKGRRDKATVYRTERAIIDDELS